MPRRPSNLVGQQFGELLVKARATPQDSSGKTWWICKCLNCGNLKTIRVDNLKGGTVIACGCMRGMRDIS